MTLCLETGAHLDAARPTLRRLVADLGNLAFLSLGKIALQTLGKLAFLQCNF